jgi:hypothetical protein
MVHATSPRPRRGCTRILCMQAMSLIQGSNPDESEGDTWTSHGLKGPRVGKQPQNQVDTRDQPYDPQGNHHAKSQAEVGPQGVDRPHRSAKPTLCRLILAFHVVSPGWLLVHSRGAHTILTKLSKAYKNRREGTHFLPNSLSNSSLTFGFQGYEVG